MTQRSLRTFAKEVASRWHAIKRPQATFPGAVVCCYHGVRSRGVALADVPFGQLHVSQEEFDAHCAVFREFCDPIGLEDLLGARSRNDLPERPVLVAFDDVYASVPRVAAPILQRHKIRAAMFVCDGPVRERRAFWYDAAARAQGEDAVQRLKVASFDEWQRLAESAPTIADSDPMAPPTVSELSSAAQSGSFSIGGHTTWHPILARAPLDAQAREITGNRRALHVITGQEPLAFAYPNGEPRDYTQETVDLVRGAGYAAAFTTTSGYAMPEGNRYEWPRFLMLAGITRAELLHRLFFSWPRTHAA